MLQPAAERNWQLQQRDDGCLFQVFKAEMLLGWQAAQ